MKSIKIAGLCLVAMFVVSMVAAGSAWAEETKPYIIQCREKAGSGHFKNEQCSEVEANGKYETRLGGALGEETFSSSSGAGELETANKEKITCTSDKDEGKIKNSKEFEKVRVIFSGCESKGFKCNSTNTATAGEIITNPLKGGVEYIKNGKINKEVAEYLEPETPPLYVEFNCAGGIVKVQTKGIILGKITPVNTCSKTATLTYEKGVNPGEQKITELESGTKDTLESSKNGGAFEKSANSSTDTLTFQYDVCLLA